MTEIARKYGPWAVITGASDGTGAEFARQLAAEGLNLLLIARREGPLDSLAADIGGRFGVEVRTASIDLAGESAASQVMDAVGDLEIGLFVANAGADPNGSRFLDAQWQAWHDLLWRNVLAVSECSYQLAGPMRERKRGGIVILSSGAALYGQPGGAIYSATKSFQLNFCESLWSELRHDDVDVLCGVCGAMDTPSLHKLLDENGREAPPLLQPADVVADFLAALGQKPVHITPYLGNDEQMKAIEQQRYEALLFMEEATKAFYG